LTRNAVGRSLPERSTVAGDHVLVVDDEPRFLRIIRFNLEAEGYRVTCAASGEEAMALFERYDPDLVVLDVMLPGLDGFDVCTRIREISARPIIMLTAKGSDEDKVRGLRLGADDYVTKPFSAAELLARVAAVLRRVEGTPVRQPALAAGEVVIDFLAKQVSVRGQEVRLSPTEYRLLCCLATSPGVVLTRDELLEKVWGSAYRGEHEVLRVTLWRLRQKLEDDASSPRYIITRPGIGYLFAAES
jgi:DNA-binding response OmpR family regulator